jgi:pyruvate formate lyase activating enzyme
MTGNKFISVDEVINRFNKQRSFYRNGGITISGGEPLIHQIFCLELAKRCYQNNIHLAIDTSGATFTKANVVFFNKLIKYHPLFIVDIKQINKTKHKKITGCKTQNEVNLIKFLEFNKQKY